MEHLRTCGTCRAGGLALAVPALCLLGPMPHLVIAAEALTMHYVYDKQ